MLEIGLPGMQKCKELETELDTRTHQLNASKTAIMQLLEQVQASKDGCATNTAGVGQLSASERHVLDNMQVLSVQHGRCQHAAADPAENAAPEHRQRIVCSGASSTTAAAPCVA